MAWVRSAPAPYGGIGMLNKGGNVSFENGKINDQLMPAYQGMVHYFYGQNYLTINNSEIYTCPDEFYKMLEPPPAPPLYPCHTVQTITSGPPPSIPVASIGSTLLWGGPVMPNIPVNQCLRA